MASLSKKYKKAKKKWTMSFLQAQQQMDKEMLDYLRVKAYQNEGKAA